MSRIYMENGQVQVVKGGKLFFFLILKLIFKLKKIFL